MELYRSDYFFIYVLFEIRSRTIKENAKRFYAKLFGTVCALCKKAATVKERRLSSQFRTVPFGTLRPQRAHYNCVSAVSDAHYASPQQQQKGIKTSNNVPKTRGQIPHFSLPARRTQWINSVFIRPQFQILPDPHC